MFGAGGGRGGGCRAGDDHTRAQVGPRAPREHTEAAAEVRADRPSCGGGGGAQKHTHPFKPHMEAEVIADAPCSGGGGRHRTRHMTKGQGHEVR